MKITRKKHASKQETRCEGSLLLLYLILSFSQYVLDIFNAGIAGTSCTLAVIEAMDTSIENVTLVEQTFCQYERDTLEWDEDPCCNRDLRVFDNISFGFF